MRICNFLSGLFEMLVSMSDKRLGSVLAHIQQQHELLEQQNQRNRSQKMPSRRAQKTAIQQRNLNPVLDLEMPV